MISEEERKLIVGAHLEVSTAIPCILHCRYCPQSVLKEKYKSDIKMLSLNNFMIAVDKLPADSQVTFSAFNEPFQNPEMVEMVQYAYDCGHRISINTTLMGVDVSKYEKIKELNLINFGVHLPDNEGNTVVRITNQYKELLKYIIDNPPPYMKFNHHAGDIHNDIKDIVPLSHKLLIHNRCGILKEGRADYHPNASRCRHEFQFTNDRGGAVLLPNGDCVTCCHAFDLSGYLGNLFIQTWEEIESNIKPIDLCKHCIDAIED